MFPKHTRLPTRQRCSIVPYCGKKSKANNNRDNSNQPLRLTPESIKALGGLKNATRLIEKKEEITRSGRSARSETRKYRKKKKSSNEYAAEKAKLEVMERENGNTHDMYQNYYGSPNHNKPSVLLIDGYNLLFEMKKQQKDQFEGLELSQARYKMEEDILSFIQGVRTRVVIVYDALQNPNRDEEGNGLEEDEHDSLKLIFCQKYEADKGISLMCEQYVKEGTPDITVITSDRSVRQNCQNLPCVHCKRSKIFWKDICNRNKELQDKIDEHNRHRNQNSLAGSLPPETLSKLSEFYEVWTEMILIKSDTYSQNSEFNGDDYN